MRGGWRWRGTVALTAVALAFVIYPIAEAGPNVVNSDWPAFATGAKLVISDPGHLYDLGVQKRAELEVTGGRQLVTLGINGILPFLAPAWVALVAVPFELLGTELGGRLWMLFGLACLALALWLAVKPLPPSALLPAFASVPTAIMMLNAQLDGMVALGIGAAAALWCRPYLAGLALGLTLMKPQLVLPLGFALIATQTWRVLAGWTTAGVILWASFAVLNPLWVLEWIKPIGGTVAAASREVDLPHLGTLLPGQLQTVGVVTLTFVAVVVVILLAVRRRDDLRASGAIVVAGGVLAAPHALPSDLVLVAVGLAIWGRAAWHDWLLLSVIGLVAAVTPAPAPAIAGVLLIAWLLARISSGSPRAPQPASTR